MILNPKYVFEQGIIQNVLEKNIQQNGIDVRIRETIFLKPKSFKNILCIEFVEIPANIAAIFHIRSSYSRQGIFLTSGIYDSGYAGLVGCSLYNLSDKKIRIDEGERIGQMLFITAESAGLYNGKWQHYGTNKHI